MKNVHKLIGVIALAAVIGFSFTACDDGSGNGGTGGNGGGGGDTSASFTMGATDILLGTSYYYLYNRSSHQVRITINGQTQTMSPYAPLTGQVHGVMFSASTPTVSVTYSPANKVRREYSTFYDN